MAGDRPPPYELATGQHGEGQASALRAGGMARDRRRRDLPVSMLYLRSGDRKLQREGPMPGRRDLLVSMHAVALE